MPAHRPTGDIDVYLTNDNDDDNRLPAWKKGDEIIRQRGIAIDYSHHHHSVFNWNGPHSTGSGQVMMENHYDIENRYADKNGRMLDNLLKELAGKGRK